MTRRIKNMQRIFAEALEKLMVYNVHQLLF